MTEDLRRLTLLIQRIVDAEILSNDEAAVLLGESEAARRSVEADDWAAARSHVERVTGLIETFMEAETLAPADGQPALQTARSILGLRQG